LVIDFAQVFLCADVAQFVLNYWAHNLSV